MNPRLDRALVSLRGLAVGDALGKHAIAPGRPALEEGSGWTAPPGPWTFTDDTVMAISIVETLSAQGRIVQDELARRFARRFAAEPDRGYGAAAYYLLSRLGQGEPWHALSSSLFRGRGSCGNGGAMRAAPIGAYFCDDLARTAVEADASAVITHWHPDGRAGAIAVAIAAAVCSQGTATRQSGSQLIDTVLAWTPPGAVQAGLRRTRALLDAPPEVAARELGLGVKILAEDTVPFALWCVATSLGDYRGAIDLALRETIREPESDRDTIAAIVGGIAVLASGIERVPEAWLAACEDPVPALAPTSALR
jgi:ADP-ribosylglycohydrolase